MIKVCPYLNIRVAESGITACSEAFKMDSIVLQRAWECFVESGGIPDIKILTTTRSYSASVVEMLNHGLKQ